MSAHTILDSPSRRGERCHLLHNDNRFSGLQITLDCVYIRAFPNFELNISSCVVKSFSRNNKHELTQRQRRQHITPLVFNWHQRPCKRSLGVFADEIMFYPEPKEFELMLQCNKCVQNKLIRRVFHINTFFGNSKCAKWILGPWVNRNWCQKMRFSQICLLPFKLLSPPLPPFDWWVLLT